MIVYNIYDIATGASVGIQALADNLSPVLNVGQAAQVIATSHGLDPAIANSVAGHVPTLDWGDAGTDYSVAAPAVPLDGTFELLATIPLNLSRAYCIVQNQSADTLQIVADDGTGANQTTFLLASGGAGNQGGAIDMSNEKGRIRIYGPPGSQVAARAV
ncbi:MAG TPA: hypothetical protein VGC09_06015 [Rhodopila sp.]